MRVLLVEDDEDDVILTRRYLADINSRAFEVDWQPDCDLALAQVRQGGYDVCLVDYRLGPRDGVEFVRQAIAGGVEAPIILLTGQGDHAIDMAAMNAGAADFLSKSHLTADGLERSIRYAIQHRKADEQRIRLLREQAAREQAEAANRSKDQFLAVLSHELRTPLTAVLLSLDNLQQETSGDARLRDLVDVIRRNIQLEARLIDDLLDLTRITRGKLELRRELVDLHEQIQYAVHTCCNDDISRKKLQVTIDPQASRVKVWGDPARLQQVLWNLLKNAAKFTPEQGRIEIRTWNDDGRIHISVADSGIGIVPEALPRIFNAFEQADRSITRQFGGLGLGLAICKAIVELHGGWIGASSKGPGQGAVFSLNLPTVGVEMRVNGAGLAPDVPKPPANTSILLVEDHPDTASAMARLLSRRGYAVHVAHSVFDALAWAEQTDFDVLVSDIGLPDGSGLELMQKLQLRRPIKGIALSGFGMEEDLERSRLAGFTEHLTKPIDFRHLNAAIARVIGQAPEGSQQSVAGQDNRN